MIHSRVAYIATEVFVPTDKELCSKVLLGNALVIQNRDGPNASEDDILANLVAQRTHARYQDRRVSHPKKNRESLRIKLDLGIHLLK